MNVRWLGCDPGNFQKGRVLGLRPEYLVIHIMEGTLPGTDSWFANPASRVSAHYGLGLDGSVHQYVQEQDTAFHAGRVSTSRFLSLQSDRGASPNAFTIGLEHEGRVDTPWSDAMYAASVELAGGICARWGIPKNAEHIVLHREIYNKACPGLRFDRPKYLALLNDVSPPPPPVVPVKLELMLLKSTNLRRGRPDRNAAIVRVMPSGAKVEVVGFTQGEPVLGNSLWYRVAEGDFFWAGGTDHPAAP